MRTHTGCRHNRQKKEWTNCTWIVQTQRQTDTQTGSTGSTDKLQWNNCTWNGSFRWEVQTEDQTNKQTERQTRLTAEYPGGADCLQKLRYLPPCVVANKCILPNNDSWWRGGEGREAWKEGLKVFLPCAVIVLSWVTAAMYWCNGRYRYTCHRQEWDQMNYLLWF